MGPTYHVTIVQANGEIVTYERIEVVTTGQGEAVYLYEAGNPIPHVVTGVQDYDATIEGVTNDNPS